MNFEFFSIDLTTILGTIINTLILFLVLRHFLFDKVNAVLDSRKNEVAKTYEDADAALTSAKQLESEYTEKLSAAKEESAEIVKNATKKAQSRSEEIIAEAKDEARGIVDKANADIEKEKKRAVNQIKDEISDMALSIASRVVSKEIDGKTHEKLIESFIDEIGE
ncbi:MAG: F0F1 ATP synthase subunit B [Oscillospiraceae bacterium]|nr:F0F1 ATP synthase subunit B [Oscillospiraceae bacterium]MDE6132528.1 F0F1 ATP synthase subunit B [Oscillospiraceae bacterium]